MMDRLARRLALDLKLVELDKTRADRPETQQEQSMADDIEFLVAKELSRYRRHQKYWQQKATSYYIYFHHKMSHIRCLELI